MSDFQEEWELYPSRIDDELAMFTVNLGLRDHVPFDNLRWLTVVRMTFGGNGLPDQDTNELMFAIEDHLTERTATRGGLHVGRLTLAGRRELFFYGATDDGEVLRREIADEFGEVEVEIDTLGRRDPEWSVYTEFLYPQPIDFRRIGNQRVVRLLAEQGDIAAVPRQIDHYAHFPDAASRSRFASSLERDRFTIKAETEAEEGELRFQLEFSSVGPVDLGSIDKLTIPLFLAIEETGGVYDGWGCSIQSAEGEPE